MHKKTVAISVIALLLLLSLGSTVSFGQGLGHTDSGSSHLKLGDLAPDFTLHDQDDKLVSLHDFRGKTVVVVFYVFSFSPTANREVAALSRQAEKLDGKVHVLAISVDSVAVNHAFADAVGLRIPLLSDRDMKIGSLYGIYSPHFGMTAAAYKEALANWVIDPSGRIVAEEKGEAALNPTPLLEKFSNVGSSPN